MSQTDTLGFGLCGFVLSLAAIFVLAVNPLLFIFQIILCFLAMIFSCIGLFGRGRQYALVGLTFAVIQLLAYIFLYSKIAALSRPF